MSFSPRKIDKLVAQSLEMEKKGAREAGSLCYFPAALVQCSLPVGPKSTSFYQRKNGNLTLTISALNPQIGLPFGSIPRLILAYIGQEAVRKKTKKIELGNLSSFLQKIDLRRTGGSRGDITRLRDQSLRLFSTALSLVFEDTKKISGKNLIVANEFSLWWNAEDGNSITLGDRFFDILTDRPVPVDFRALYSLKASALSMDIYVWLVHRLPPLKKATVVPWTCIKLQFDLNYSRDVDLRRAFCDAIKKVLIVYPDARLDVIDKGILLFPSPPHVARQSRK